MGMELLANKTTAEILALSNEGELQQSDVSRIIEAALTEAINDTSSGCHEAVNLCCSADQDMAHKIRDQMNRNTELLITNLMSMR